MCLTVLDTLMIHALSFPSSLLASLESGTVERTQEDKKDQKSSRVPNRADETQRTTTQDREEDKKHDFATVHGKNTYLSYPKEIVG